MSETASISSSIAGRYAQALFDLSQSGGGLDALAKDVETLSAALDESPDLHRLITSPIYSRGDQKRAIAALAGPMELDRLTANTLGLMAENRRLFVLPQFLRALRERIAEAKGQLTADVTSAVALTDDQRWRLAETLGKQLGKDIQLNATVDEGLIGGLVVKVGSTMIDTSVRAKLARLQNAMREVG